MPEKTQRTIRIETVNEIRSAHGKLLRCLEERKRFDEDLDEAEWLLRRALVGMGIDVPGRKIREVTRA